MESATVRGAQLEYEIHGSGEPVLLIHGVLVADGLRPLVDEGSLSDYRLILYHRRGVAGSDRVAGPFTIQDQAADARALLAELGAEPAHVVGHSFGAAIALQLAADAPEAVQTLALLEAPSVSVPSTEEVVASLEPVAARHAAGEREGAVDDFLTAMAGAPGYRQALDQRLPGAFQQAVSDSDAFFTVEFPALGEWQFTAEDAKRIQAPVLRLCGGETIQWFSECDDQLGEWLPQSERCAVPGVTHMLQMDEPSEPAVRLASFFARHPIGAAGAAVSKQAG